MPSNERIDRLEKVVHTLCAQVVRQDTELVALRNRLSHEDLQKFYAECARREKNVKIKAHMMGLDFIGEDLGAKDGAPSIAGDMNMSASPECMKCGDYVSHGPCLCETCAKQLKTENANLLLEHVLVGVEEDPLLLEFLRPQLVRLLDALQPRES